MWNKIAITFCCNDEFTFILDSLIAVYALKQRRSVDFTLRTNFGFYLELETIHSLSFGKKDLCNLYN